mgnify:CR=1 FL=1
MTTGKEIVLAKSSTFVVTVLQTRCSAYTSTVCVTAMAMTLVEHGERVTVVWDRQALEMFTRVETASSILSVAVDESISLSPVDGFVFNGS